LINYLGGKSVAGGKLKEKGTATWIDPNVGATDEYGFKALPAGFYNGNAYLGLGQSCFFWTSTQAPNPDYASSFYMYANSAEVIHYIQNDVKFGHSVRCLKN